MLDGLVVETVHRGQFSRAAEGGNAPPLVLQMCERPPVTAELEFGQGATGPVEDGFRMQPVLRPLVKGAKAPKAAKARGHTDSAFAKFQPRVQVALDLMPLRHSRAPPRSLHDAFPHCKASLKSSIPFIAPSQPPGGFDPLQTGHFSMVRSAMPVSG